MDQIIFFPYMFPLYFSPIRTTRMLYSALVDRLWGFSSSLEVVFFLSLQSCVQRAVLGCPAGSDCGSWGVREGLVLWQRAELCLSSPISTE